MQVCNYFIYIYVKSLIFNYKYLIYKIQFTSKGSISFDIDESERELSFSISFLVGVLLGVLVSEK